MFTEEELQEIKNYIINSSDISPVAVGCDANYSGGNTLFALTVGIHIDGKHGSKIFSTRVKEKRRLALREKLWREVSMALELAQEIQPICGKREFHVDLDLNPDEKEASSVIIKEAKAMVEAYGYKVRIKPYAWHSTYASDHYVRGKDKKDTTVSKRKKQ